MERKELFGIGTKRVGFLLIIVVALFLSSVQVFKGAEWLTIVSVWGSFSGTALLLVGIGKAGENKELEIKRDLAKMKTDRKED